VWWHSFWVWGNTEGNTASGINFILSPLKAVCYETISTAKLHFIACPTFFKVLLPGNRQYT
jgi:hypothetical protein